MNTMQELINEVNDFVKTHRYPFRLALNICGPRKSGKTTFLNAAKQYLATQTCMVDSTLALDFSDYEIDDFSNVIPYFKKKMSDLYLSSRDKCDLSNYTFFEKYLDIVEGSSTEEELSHSLLMMVTSLRFYSDFYSDVARPMIFIDDLARPLYYAAKFGYLDKLRKFLDAFLKIDYYEQTNGLIATSYAPLNTNIYLYIWGIRNVPVNEIEPLANFCRRQGMVLLKNSEDFANQGDLVSLYESGGYAVSSISRGAVHYDIKLTPEIKDYISNSRELIRESPGTIRSEREYQERKRKRAQSAQSNTQCLYTDANSE